MYICFNLKERIRLYFRCQLYFIGMYTFHGKLFKNLWKSYKIIKLCISWMVKSIEIWEISIEKLRVCHNLKKMNLCSWHIEKWNYVVLHFIWNFLRWIFSFCSWICDNFYHFWTVILILVLLIYYYMHLHKWILYYLHQN